MENNLMNQIKTVDDLDWFDKITAIQLAEDAFKRYNESPEDEKPGLKKLIEDRIEAHKNGIEHIGMGFDAIKVAAGIKFLELIKEK